MNKVWYLGIGLLLFIKTMYNEKNIQIQKQKRWYIKKKEKRVILLKKP